MNITTEGELSTWKYSLFLSGIPLLMLFAGCGSTPADNTSSKEVPELSLNVTPDYVIGIGRVEPEGKIIEMYPQSEGIINKVNVKLGDIVSKDEILFTIDSKGAEEQISIALAQIEEQQASVSGVKVDIDKAKILSENSKRNYLRIKSVYDKGAETAANLDRAEDDYKSAEEDVKRLQANLRFEQARLKEFQALQRSARSNVQRYLVKAPSDGQILSVEVAVGSSVTLSSSLGQFAPKGSTVVVTEIDELYAALVKSGQKAFIRPQGSRDTVAVGYTIELSPSLKQKSLFRDGIGQLEDRRVREVKIRIDKGMDQLIYGARVEAVISTKEDTVLR